MRFDVDGATLHGDLIVPPGATGIVVFVHGSGSSRHSPRNQAVARHIREAGLGTLLFDLLSMEEEETDRIDAHLRFDIPRLARRLQEVTRALGDRTDVGRLPLGYIGSSTGGGAALLAAAEDPEPVRAVVSRGGRPDLAGPALPKVRCPVLLIVGERDREVLAMNRDAAAAMQAPVELDVIPGATHLFEEPGTLEQAADSARRFFERHLGSHGRGG